MYPSDENVDKKLRAKVNGYESYPKTNEKMAIVF